MATIFGIRHHGPGCAQSLARALDALRPDCVLVEGPPDAQEELAAAGHAAMRPPVALLVYPVDAPDRGSFFPFAEFSPEWQAIRWALRHGVEVRFCDLPQAVRFALRDEADGDGEREREREVADPMQWLARADGYSDSERWWNDRIEEGRGDAGLFEAILAGVTALRGELALEETRETLLREASMRRSLREAEKQGFTNIAFVCGAWHAPTLAAETSRRDDDALLKGLPKTKVRATWAPWTHRRLCSASGYGAGVTSPGWYENLFRSPGEPMVPWLVRAARHLREHDLEASSASAVEAVRLAEALASLRGRPRPGLPESLEAMCAVFAGGDDAHLLGLQQDLLIGERLGALPDDAARLPLEQDIQAQQKALRLPPTAAEKIVALDLREESGRRRSVFLHRLRALGVDWGEPEAAERGRGTFKEVWRLCWRPELALAIVDAAGFGNTVEAATGAALRHRGERADTLDTLVQLLDRSLLADCASATTALLTLLRDRSATTHDAAALLTAVPPLCRMSRYGSVRELDRDAVRTITEGLATRAHLALPQACSGIDDDAAAARAGQLRQHHAALQLLDDAALVDDERLALLRLADQQTAHPMLRGLCCRFLHERGALQLDTVLPRELSRGNDPTAAAHWLDGLLRDAGTFLAHDRQLLRVLDDWVDRLDGETFVAVLPLVRRTFATFSGPERRQVALGLQRRGDAVGTPRTAPTLQLDTARAAPAVAAVAQLLGLSPAGQEPRP